MTKAHPMTDLISAVEPSAAQPATEAVKAAAALAILDESLAYYTPETPVVIAEETAEAGYIAYYEAA